MTLASSGMCVKYLNFLSVAINTKATCRENGLFQLTSYITGESWGRNSDWDLETGMEAKTTEEGHVLACSQMWGMWRSTLQRKSGVESEAPHAPVTLSRVLTYYMALDLRWLLDTGETPRPRQWLLPLPSRKSSQVTMLPALMSYLIRQGFYGSTVTVW